MSKPIEDTIIDGLASALCLLLNGPELHKLAKRLKDEADRRRDANVQIGPPPTGDPPGGPR